MKRRIYTILATALLLMIPCMTHAEELKNAEVQSDTFIETDLNGDGSNETLSWRIEVYEEYEEQAIVEVISENGAAAMWESGPLFGAQMFMQDMDGDGCKELFITGDQMSDDYLTFCLNYMNGNLRPVFFADAVNGDSSMSYYKGGYGKLVALDLFRITLCGAQDFLGSYMAERTFAMIDGCFELQDDRMWHVASVENEAERWEYNALTLRQDAAVTFYKESGEETGILYAGEKILVTGSDKAAFVNFKTQDGRTGYLSVSVDYERGFGMLVNGVPENDVFEMIPYAG